MYLNENASIREGIDTAISGRNNCKSFVPKCQTQFSEVLVT